MEKRLENQSKYFINIQIFLYGARANIIVGQLFVQVQYFCHVLGQLFIPITDLESNYTTQTNKWEAANCKTDCGREAMNLVLTHMGMVHIV